MISINSYTVKCILPIYHLMANPFIYRKVHTKKKTRASREQKNMNIDMRKIEFLQIYGESYVYHDQPS